MGEEIISKLVLHKGKVTVGSIGAAAGVLLWLMEAGFIVTPAQVKAEIVAVETKITDHTTATKENSDAVRALERDISEIKSAIKSIDNELKEQREDRRRVLELIK